jgi:acetylornithine deacetylase/succinyl-diaminopimelate desuccinylase-like protein
MAVAERVRLKAVAGALVLVLATHAPGAAEAPSHPEVRAWRSANEHAILDEFTRLLAIPNVATDRDDIRRNAKVLVEMMQKRGLNPRLLAIDDPDAPPAVYGEWKVPGATRTLVFYAHYDGQPVTPSDWASDPWVPTWRDGPLGGDTRVVQLPGDGAIDPQWRIYGRGASDDKAGVMAILAATDALKAAGATPTFNLKIFFDGEEEQGSPHLQETLERHRDLLASEAWIIADGPVHPSGRPQVVYGVRGDFNAELTVYGPKRPLHSGHYGNWAPNPALRLARLLSSMKDESGRVVIAGWYDDVVALSDAERAAIAAAPQPDVSLKRELGLAEVDTVAPSLLEAINLPSLNINGLRSAEVGAKAANVIPVSATAALDLRLVKGNTVERQFERLGAHVRAQGFHVIDRAPTDAERLQHPLIATLIRIEGGYGASRTPMDLPISREVAAAVQAASAQPVVLMPSLGGSLPLIVVNDTLGVPTITVPIANHDNNQHAENENLRLQNLWDGIETYASLLRLGTSR